MRKISAPSVKIYTQGRMLRFFSNVPAEEGLAFVECFSQESEDGEKAELTHNRLFAWGKKKVGRVEN